MQVLFFAVYNAPFVFYYCIFIFLPNTTWQIFQQPPPPNPVCLHPASHGGMSQDVWKGGAEPFPSSRPSGPTCHRLWEDVIASLWPPAPGSLPGPDLTHHSAHPPLLVWVQHSGTAHTGLKERFQRPWAAILNVVVRRTSPGGVGSMRERVCV